MTKKILYSILYSYEEVIDVGILSLSFVFSTFSNPSVVLLRKSAKYAFSEDNTFNGVLRVEAIYFFIYYFIFQIKHKRQNDCITI